MTTHGTGSDVLERTKDRVEDMSRDKMGNRGSVYHWLALGSIGASLALYFAGKKSAAIFVGLWPPTFEALRRRED
ncbi:MAG: hypothetical protein SFV54_18005 [Bryobacteraceae bacterium]|nr:hypothetical protein [Bryobacteraceae bacterium]